MLKKSGKFYADWRDAAGTRHRKAFTTLKAASRHQARMQKDTASKKAKAHARSGK